MINVEVAEPGVVAESAGLGDAVAAVEAQLGNHGRVLVRASGTEPVLRVMVEGDDEAQVAAHAQQLAEAAESLGKAGVGKAGV